MKEANKQRQRTRSRYDCSIRARSRVLGSGSKELWKYLNTLGTRKPSRRVICPFSSPRPFFPPSYSSASPPLTDCVIGRLPISQGGPSKVHLGTKAPPPLYTPFFECFARSSAGCHCCTPLHRRLARFHDSTAMYHTRTGDRSSAVWFLGCYAGCWIFKGGR